MCFHRVLVMKRVVLVQEEKGYGPQWMAHHRCLMGCHPSSSLSQPCDKHADAQRAKASTSVSLGWLGNGRASELTRNDCLEAVNFKWTCYKCLSSRKYWFTHPLIKWELLPPTTYVRLLWKSGERQTLDMNLALIWVSDHEGVHPCSVTNLISPIPCFYKKSGSLSWWNGTSLPVHAEGHQGTFDSWESTENQQSQRWGFILKVMRLTLPSPTSNLKYWCRKQSQNSEPGERLQVLPKMKDSFQEL